MRKRAPSWRKKWASDNNANVARADYRTAGDSPASPDAESWVVPSVVSRSGQNERLARFVADAADHGFESVRSLWCEVLAQSEAVEQRQRVDIQNLARRLF